MVKDLGASLLETPDWASSSKLPTICCGSPLHVDIQANHDPNILREHGLVRFRPLAERLMRASSHVHLQRTWSCKIGHPMGLPLAFPTTTHVMARSKECPESRQYGCVLFFRGLSPKTTWWLSETQQERVHSKQDKASCKPRVGPSFVPTGQP